MLEQPNKAAAMDDATMLSDAGIRAGVRRAQNDCRDVTAARAYHEPAAHT